MRLLIRAFLFTVPVILFLCSCGDDDPVTPKGATYTLYFSQDDNGNGLFRINTSTGAGTLVGNGISGVTSNTVGLAYNTATGVLYGSRWATLLEIQVDGSAAVDLGGVGNEALAYDDDAGILYGCLNGDFRTINPADGTVAIALTDPGQDVEGLAVDPATGDVYGLAPGTPASLMKYDKVSNTWSTVGSTGMEMDDPGLAYHPVRKLLYALDANSASIYTIDPADATTTLVGPHGISGVGGGGLAFVRN